MCGYLGTDDSIVNPTNAPLGTILPALSAGALILAIGEFFHRIHNSPHDDYFIVLCQNDYHEGSVEIEGPDAGHGFCLIVLLSFDSCLIHSQVCSVFDL